MHIRKPGNWFAVVIIWFVMFVPANAAESKTKAHVPSLVGAWEIYVPGATGNVHWVFQFRPDGTYTLNAPGVGHSGTYAVPTPGHWTLQATTTNFADHGTYRLIDPDTLHFHGQLGTGDWKRITTAMDLPDMVVDGQRVPAGLRPIVKLETTLARSDWHPDAIPVELDLRPLSYGGFEAELDLYSPSTGAGRIIIRTSFDRTMQDIPRANWGSNPIVPNFIDLPAALKTAHASGMKTPMRRATLRTWDAGSVWLIFPNAGDGVQVSAQDKNTVISGDVTGAVASYNAQWNTVIAGIQKLLQKAGGRTPGFHPVPRTGYFLGMTPASCRGMGGKWWGGDASNGFTAWCQ